MSYGGVERGDKRKEAGPKPRNKEGQVASAGEDKTASQETNFTGKRTYPSGGEEDAEQRGKD